VNDCAAAGRPRAARSLTALPGLGKPLASAL